MRPSLSLALGRHRRTLDRALVMGVLNVTPDSFSDGGRFMTAQRALDRACAMREEGVDIVDIGGESTRPGASPVPEAEEIERVMPVLEALIGEPTLADTPISVDTRKPGVMRAAIAAGASMINDVASLQAPGALDVVAPSDVAVCLMHMQGDPGTMQLAPHYDDVVGQVRALLRGRAEIAVAAGIAHERIVVDPGFGFGKTREHNVTLLQRLDAFAELGFPILCGLSRKGLITPRGQRGPSERLGASLAATLAAVTRGAAIVRVHDVRETVDALRVWSAAMPPSDPPNG
jgi:dihydropteroate synthase